MVRSGRPRTPTEVKRLRGTYRKDRSPSNGAITVIAPGEIVTDDPTSPGQDLRRSLLEAGANAWISSVDQLATLDLLCQAWDERIQIKEELADAFQAAHRASLRRQIRDLEKQITQWLSLLGLTPSDRSRLGVAEVKAISKLEEIKARRAGRLAG